MQNFFRITTRRWKEILIITLLTAILAVTFGFIYNKTSFNNTIFINVGYGPGNGSNALTSPLDAVQAADQFSETVQGWLKDPLLVEEIRTQAQYNVDFSVRKQEKQNLVATYRTGSENQAKKVSQAAEEILRAQIGNYNLETDGDFKMPVFDLYSVNGAFHPALFAVMGIILGLLLGYFFSALWDKFTTELNQFRHGKS